MRDNLRRARQEKNMTQKQVAEYLGIKDISYRQIENGSRIGKIETWDKLEDLFKIHQRILREKS